MSYRQLLHVALLGLATSSAGIAQQHSDPLTDQPVVKREPGRVAARLVLVKADWSDVADAEDVEEQLQSLLQDAELSDSYRDNLLASAPKILFSDELVSLYQPEELNGLLSWLADRELIRFEDATSPQPEAEGKLNAEDATADGPKWRPIWQSHIAIPHEVVPNPQTHVEQPPPFVKRTYEWEWEFRSRLETDGDGGLSVMQVAAQSVPQRRDVLADGKKTIEVTKLSGPRLCGFDFPPERVAVLNPLHSLSEGHGSLIRQQGWEPVFIITSETRPLPPRDKPKLAKPTSLAKITRYSRLRFASRPSVPATSDPSATATNRRESTTLKVFTLKHASSRSVVEILQQLLANSSFVADERTNSVIVRGDKDELEIAEALLLRLDETDAKGDEKDRSGSARVTLQQLVQSTQADYLSTEAQAQNLAETLANEADDQAAKQVRDQLALIVAEAFALRQQLQQAQADLLRERIRGIETSLKQRESLRDEIIKRRVEQLAKGDAPPTRVPETASDLTARGRGSVASAETTPSKAPTGPSVDRTTLRSLDDFQKAAMKAYEEVSQFRKFRDLLQQQGHPVTLYDNAIAKAQQRLANLRDEYSAQLRLFELDAQAADAALDAAEKAKARVKTLFDGGRVSSGEMDHATLALEQAKVAREKSHTLLALYLKSGVGAGLVEKAKPEPTANANEALVWVEAIVPSKRSDGEPTRSAGYANGAVVSPDSLVAVPLGDALRELWKSGAADEIAITVFTPRNQALTARVVNIDNDSPIALLKVEEELPYLAIRDTAMARGQQVSVIFQLNHRGGPTWGETTVAEVPGADPSLRGRRFELSDPYATTGLVLANDYKLQGLVLTETREVKGNGLIQKFHALAISTEKLPALIAEYREASGQDGIAEITLDNERVQVEALLDLDALILRGGKDDVQRVADLIRQVEGKDDTPEVTHLPKPLDGISLEMGWLGPLFDVVAIKYFATGDFSTVSPPRVVAEEVLLFSLKANVDIDAAAMRQLFDNPLPGLVFMKENGDELELLKVRDDHFLAPHSNRPWLSKEAPTLKKGEALQVWCPLGKDGAKELVEAKATKAMVTRGKLNAN